MAHNTVSCRVLCGDETQRHDLVWVQRKRDLLSIDSNGLLILLKQIGIPRSGQSKTSRQGDGTALALTLVKAHNHSVAIFGLLDRLDDDVGPIYSDKRSQLLDAVSTSFGRLIYQQRIVQSIGSSHRLLIPAPGVGKQAISKTMLALIGFGVWHGGA